MGRCNRPIGPLPLQSATGDLAGSQETAQARPAAPGGTCHTAAHGGICQLLLAWLVAIARDRRQRVTPAPLSMDSDGEPLILWLLPGPGLSTGGSGQQAQLHMASRFSITSCWNSSRSLESLRSMPSPAAFWASS